MWCWIAVIQGTLLLNGCEAESYVLRRELRNSKMQAIV